MYFHYKDQTSNGLCSENNNTQRNILVVNCSVFNVEAGDQYTCVVINKFKALITASHFNCGHIIIIIIIIIIMARETLSQCHFVRHKLA